MTPADRLFEQLTQTAHHDPDVLGLVLVSSRGKGLATPFSDYDAYLVVQNGAVESAQHRYTQFTAQTSEIDLTVMPIETFLTFAAWGSAEAWERYSFANATTLIDKTGKIHQLVLEKGCLPPHEQDTYVRSALDGYINGVYRSAKCWRVHNVLGARLEAMDSIGYFLSLIFGLEGRHRPYYGYLERELRVYPLQRFPLPSEALLDSLARILTTADLPTQQTLLRTVEPVCRAAGIGDVIDSWGQDYPWMISFQPESPSL
jgi:hypothetical protein